VEVRSRCSRLGTKSFDLVHELRAGDGRLVAEAVSVLVAYDYRRGESVELSDHLRTRLGAGSAVT
jgi:acyl-CoA thioesterase FadM